jgi:hypothetical protein
MTRNMGFGMRMRMLSRHRWGVAISIALAALAAVWTVNEISLSPLSLKPRSLEMASASTEVVVDTPSSTLLDLRQDTYSFEALRNRAVLLGSVMASLPVRDEIARRARVPADVLQVAAPRTPEQPRTVVGAGTERRPTDILRSNDQYRLSVQVNATVPILSIYAQTPDAKSSARLANAAVDTMRARLATLARAQHTPDGAQIRLLQLGRARGGVINGGVSWSAALLAFLLTLAFSCATVVFLARLRAGWRLESRAERTALS